MTKIRNIEMGGYHATPVTVPDQDTDISAWLTTKAQEYNLTTLLAHADDGIIWGRIDDDGQLLTSHQVFENSPSPPLRMVTLQQARLFGEQAELLLWQDHSGWHARFAEETAEGEHYDEVQMLWGNQHGAVREGFTLMHEGQQGLHHAPPKDVPRDKFVEDHHPLRLRVRHYLQTDSKTGLLRATLSRLVKLEIEEKKEVSS